MKVTLERLPQSRVLLEIEVEPEKLEESIEAEYRKFAARARVPGFRPGKAPRPAIERQMGGAKNLRAALLDDAIQRLIPEAYNAALVEQDIDAIDQPKLEIVEIEPVRFKATVPVRPSVELGDYRSVRVEAPAVEITQEQIDEQIEALRQRHATLAPVERPAAWNDHVIASLRATVNGEQILDDEDRAFPLREGQVMLLEGLLDGFVGMSAGETKTIELTFPEDFSVSRVAGATGTFELSLKEVKEEQLPEKDDEFANMVNPEFETYDALVASIRESLENRAKAEADDEVRLRALDLVVAGATLDLPDVLVDREIDRMIQQATGTSADAYRQQLARIGSSDEEFRERFREAAETRVRRSLVLTELARVEEISVTPEEVEQEVEQLVAPMGDDAGRFRDLFLGQGGRETIERDLVTRKTLARLVEIATSGEPVPAAATETEAAAAPAGTEPDAAGTEEEDSE